jgi:hypothetical protein
MVAAGLGSLPNPSHWSLPAPGHTRSTSAVVANPAFNRPVGGYVTSDTGASARLHKRNRLDWVGVLHKQLMKGAGAGVLSTNRATSGCERVASYLASRPELIAKFGKSDAVRSSALLGAFVGGACGDPLSEKQVRQLLRSGSSGVHGANGSTQARTQSLYTRVSLASPHRAPRDVTSAADPYFDDIASAADAATDPDSYASALSSILDAAESNLTGDDLDAVDAVASVAQSSFEQWYGGTEGVSDATSMHDDYGPCILEEGQQIIPDDQILTDCGISGHLISLRVLPRKGPQRRGMVSTGSRSRRAGTLSCGWNWGDVVGDDIAGAVGGAIAGAAGGGIGAVPGAAVGGAGASVGRAAVEDIKYIICCWGS